VSGSGKGVISCRHQTLALLTISKQWRPLTFLLVCGHIRPSVSQIPLLKLYIASCQIWWLSNRRYKPTTGSRHACHAHTGNGQGLEFLASVAEWLTIASKLFALKVEVLENAWNYPFSEILSHLLWPNPKLYTL